MYSRGPEAERMYTYEQCWVHYLYTSSNDPLSQGRRHKMSIKIIYYITCKCRVTLRTKTMFKQTCKFLYIMKDSFWLICSISLKVYRCDGPSFVSLAPGCSPCQQRLLFIGQYRHRIPSNCTLVNLNDTAHHSVISQLICCQY